MEILNYFEFQLNKRKNILKNEQVKLPQLVTGKTVICGIIGDPVEHSMSPIIQNAAFRALGLDYFYIPFRVNKEELPSAIQGIRALNIHGINVTIPHKASVLSLLDRVDNLASTIGAVNTILNSNGFLTGYNTDAEGFIRPLIEKGISITGKKVLIIGAGGAAKAIAFTLVEHGALITIINRSREKANVLAKQLGIQFTVNVETLVLNNDNLENALSSAYMLVNATSIGMVTNESPVPSQFLRNDLFVYDIVYNPLETRLLREAKATGASIMRGADMLAWQGGLAFEKWTGHKAPIELMKSEIYRKLT